MTQAFNEFDPNLEDNKAPQDAAGNLYKHCIELNHQKFWCHLIIDEDEWKVFENDEVRIQVMWDDTFEVGRGCEITIEHKDCDDPRWHKDDDYESF